MRLRPQTEGLSLSLKEKLLLLACLKMHLDRTHTKKARKAAHLRGRWKT